MPGRRERLRPSVPYAIVLEIQHEGGEGRGMLQASKRLGRTVKHLIESQI